MCSFIAQLLALFFSIIFTATVNSVFPLLILLFCKNKKKGSLFINAMEDTIHIGQNDSVERFERIDTSKFTIHNNLPC